MFLIDFFIFLSKDLIFYNFYFFWLSYWSEFLLCQSFILYFFLLLYFSTNLFKSFLYTFNILIYCGLYLGFIQFDIFMCFLWLFEFVLFFLLFILLIIFQNNINYNYIFCNNKKLLYYSLIFILIFNYYFDINLLFLIDSTYIFTNYFCDIYYFFNNLNNDLFLLFLFYYYYFTLIIFIVLFLILLLTYVIIVFFKILKYLNLKEYVYFWNLGNKFLKKQTYEQQSIKKNSIYLFM